MTLSLDSALRGQRALWQVALPMPADLREELQGRSPMLCHLLYRRGHRTPDAIEAFFAGMSISHDPFELPDMDRAVWRIGQAIEERERVAVYGDFDCDGITSAAILVSTLRGCGLDPVVHIPARTDGHGLHPEALARLADSSIDLVVTADCGVGAVTEVQVARGMGLDVIVTDHHEARADGLLPDCPTVAPTRHDSHYPCRFLCGAGVAYKMAQAIAQRIPSAPSPDDLLDLVALGTVADVVPMLDENRSLVVRGLEYLRRTKRPGLLALFKAAGIERERIDPISIGFYLAPRINAANRMATPQLAYDCLTAPAYEGALILAQELSKHNVERQTLVGEHYEAIVGQFGSATDLAAEVQAGMRPPMLAVIGSWPSGISGLLASKLVDTYGLPAFVGADGGGASISVSARGIPTSRIDEMLEACEAALPGGLFLAYGGHARAGGFHVDRDQIGTALALLSEQAAGQVDIDALDAVLEIDAEISLRQVTVDAVRQVRSLAPFGMDFPEPLFLCRGGVVTRISPMRGGKHARFKLRHDGVQLDGVFFNISPAFLQLSPGSSIDAVFHLDLNEWRGTVKPEVRLRDWRPSVESSAIRTK